MSQYRVVAEYACPPAKVWRALVEPDLMARWTATGQGARPVGFAAEVGRRFQLVGRPTPGWNGVIECEVLEVREGSLLRYSWQSEGKGAVTQVVCRVEPTSAGSRLTFEHTGFSGLGGFLVSKILASVRRKMLTVGLPAVLAGLDDASLDRSHT